MSNEHARPSPLSSTEPPRPEARAPSHAERCRTLVAGARAATLATLARDPAGYPYASLVTVAIDTQGRPLFLLSELAEHTGNLRAHPEASALLTEPLDTHGEPLALGRVTILGPCTRVPEADLPAARATFHAHQPSASYYVDFSDFAFYRLEPTALRYVGGFGRMSWVSVADYGAAEPDPLRAAAPGVLQHMNQDHTEACAAYARALGGLPDATAATMTSVDRYGFDLAATTPAGPRATRVAFAAPVATADEVRKAMIALLQRARATP